MTVSDSQVLLDCSGVHALSVRRSDSMDRRCEVRYICQTLSIRRRLGRGCHGLMVHFVVPSVTNAGSESLHGRKSQMKFVHVL